MQHPSDLAIDALNASLARDSATPCTWRPDRDAYLEEMRAELRALIIEPVPVDAYAGEWAQKYCGLAAGPHKRLAVAHSWQGVGQCLLYESETGLFSLAYGHPGDPKGLDLVGYSSDDALAEWLG
jgi:hypothetical protein